MAFSRSPATFNLASKLFYVLLAPLLLLVTMHPKDGAEAKHRALIPVVAGNRGPAFWKQWSQTCVCVGCSGELAPWLARRSTHATTTRQEWTRTELGECTEGWAEKIATDSEHCPNGGFNAVRGASCSARFGDWLGCLILPEHSKGNDAEMSFPTNAPHWACPSSGASKIELCSRSLHGRKWHPGSSCAGASTGASGPPASLSAC